MLLEPSTEGRLAATLARHGEGWWRDLVAVRPDEPASDTRAVGVRSRGAAGPFGPERLFLDGPVSGPHRLVVRPPGTIAP